MNLEYYRPTQQNIKQEIDKYLKGNVDKRPPLNQWNVSNITDMSGLFKGYTNFNENIELWIVSKVIDMHDMFYGCTSFNQSLNAWDVSTVIDMQGMFYGCKSFNQPLYEWTVSSVETMQGMFCGCTVFDQPLNNWKVPKVENMGEMFYMCERFNQFINTWDVSTVKDMHDMFYGCISFDKSLDTWDISKHANILFMFYHCKKMSLDHYPARAKEFTINKNETRYDIITLTDYKISDYISDNPKHFVIQIKINSETHNIYFFDKTEFYLQIKKAYVTKTINGEEVYLINLQKLGIITNFAYGYYTDFMSLLHYHDDTQYFCMELQKILGYKTTSKIGRLYDAIAIDGPEIEAKSVGGRKSRRIRKYRQHRKTKRRYH